MNQNNDPISSRIGCLKTLLSSDLFVIAAGLDSRVLPAAGWRFQTAQRCLGVDSLTYFDQAPKRFPIHRANKPYFAGNAAPRTAKTGNTPWVNICKTNVPFHEILPGVVPDSRLSTWSRFIEKYTKAQVATVNNTKTQLNKTRRSSAGKE